MEFLKVESYKRGIALSTLFNILNKGLVFISSLLVAYFFGTQIKTDIYFYAYNTVVILSAFITSLNASVLVPESMAIRIKEGEKKAQSFLNFFIYGYSLLTILICVFFLVNPVHAFNAVSGFDVQELEKSKQILFYIIPLIIMIPVVNLMTDILTSYKFFTIPMMAGILNGIFSICFLLLFHNRLGVLSLAIGLLFSYGLNFLLLVLLMANRLHWNFQLIRFIIPTRIWKNIGFAQAGNITSSLSTYTPLYLLSGLGAGVITSLNFAQQVSSLPTNLVTNQFSAVSGIKFNELNAYNNITELNKVFITTTNFLIFALMPISGIFFLYSEEIVILLFKRGAFDIKSAETCALFLRYLGLLLPMLAINTMVARIFMATHRIKQAFGFQFVLNLFMVVLIFLGVKYFDILGYLYAVVGVYLLSTMLLMYLFQLILPFIKYGTVLSYFFRIALLNTVIVGALYFIQMILKEFVNPVLFFLGGSLLYGIAILLVNNIFHLNNEVQSFASTAKTFLIRK